jgi:DNA-binding NarL/FixJ family response regulator
MLRVVVADDSLLVREGIRRIFEHDKGLDVVAEGVDLESTLEAVERSRPDVVLTDVRLPPSNRDEGITIANLLRHARPEVGVIILSQHADWALSLFEEGSARRGYLLKDRLNDASQLVEAIHVVAAGGSFVDPKVVDTLLRAQAARNDSPLASLSEREREVLTLVAAGLSNAAIAHRLWIGTRAVERHVGSIFVKLGLPSEGEVNRRVVAALTYLAETETRV